MMAMTDEGPLLETLTRRLAETPPEFLAEPIVAGKGRIRVEAVVADLIRDLGGQPLAANQVAHFRTRDAKRGRNRLRLVLLACWLLHDPWFRAQGRFALPALRFLTGGLDELAAEISAEACCTDPDRREELVRLCLSELGLRPAGETLEQAQDRLATISSSERQRVIRAARAAEARARQIREAMAKQAAYDAEMKAMRE